MRRLETDYAIEVSHVSKQFRVNHREYGSLKSQVTATIKGMLTGRSVGGHTVRQALDDVSFNVTPGECVAVIGRNGSGKSTLLSILSRIYLPTSGECRIYGRMISLLELGVGFNPELTGSENVYFNGAILGLSDREVDGIYDRIVEFSELSAATLDLPVRMYSSGMQLRLGFAVAAHMDADTLLIDEGLAVGDEGFQRKCAEKIDEFRKAGRTILLVTHSAADVRRLAERAIWLDQGKVMEIGDVETVLEAYQGSFQ